MIRGLIQQQRIGRIHEHASQGYTISFPAAQRLDRLFLVLPRKQKRPSQAAKKIRFCRA